MRRNSLFTSIAGRAVVVARFVLPKGGYATTVLGRACHVVDATRPAAANEPEEPQAGDDEENRDP